VVAFREFHVLQQSRTITARPFYMYSDFRAFLRASLGLAEGRRQLLVPIKVLVQQLPPQRLPSQPGDQFSDVARVPPGSRKEFSYILWLYFIDVVRSFFFFFLLLLSVPLI
jgi:hypothetical protein